MEHSPLRPVPSRPAGPVDPGLGAALARARKALRRSMFPLSGSGWCERAERLLSDRLDGALDAPGPAPLDVHLRNCPRCVEHERRLVQATDAMVAAFAPSPAPSPAPAAAPPLSVVERSAAPPPAVLPFGEPVRPAPPRVPKPRPVIALPPPPEPVAPAPPAPLPRTPRVAPAVAWDVLLVLAAILAIAAVVIAVAGALGASI